jgi:hypothetical protein
MTCSCPAFRRFLSYATTSNTAFAHVLRPGTDQHVPEIDSSEEDDHRTLRKVKLAPLKVTTLFVAAIPRLISCNTLITISISISISMCSLSTTRTYPDPTSPCAHRTTPLVAHVKGGEMWEMQGV